MFIIAMMNSSSSTDSITITDNEFINSGSGDTVYVRDDGAADAVITGNSIAGGSMALSFIIRH